MDTIMGGSDVIVADFRVLPRNIFANDINHMSEWGIERQTASPLKNLDSRNDSSNKQAVVVQ